MSTELQKYNPAECMKMATDVAGVSKEIVMKTAINIKGKKYVKVEGWQAIAVAHGCILSSRSVESTATGIRAIGEVRRIDNGIVIATAEGFVGNDEEWGQREEYVRRAMAQTRSMSRAARSAFAHVVVMIDSGLSTTPAEEVPHTGFDSKINYDQAPKTIEAHNPGHKFNNRFANGKWKDVEIHFGKNKGIKLVDLNPKSLHWYRVEWKPVAYNGVISAKDLDLREALDQSHKEHEENKNNQEDFKYQIDQDQPEIEKAKELEADNIPY